MSRSYKHSGFFVGESLAEARGESRVVSTRGHLWGALGDTVRAALCQPSKSKGRRRSPPLPTLPFPVHLKSVK